MNQILMYIVTCAGLYSWDEWVVNEVVMCQNSDIATPTLFHYFLQHQRGCPLLGDSNCIATIILYRETKFSGPENCPL